MKLPDESREHESAAEDSGKFNVFPAVTLEEKPIWLGLYESIRDSMFPQKLPPLELTSKPIPVLDRMAVRANPWAIGTATFVNGGVLAIIILLGLRAAIHQGPKSGSSAPINLSDYPFFAALKSHAAGGGGGGGSRDLIDPIEGRTPRIEKSPITPPMIPLIEHPKLPADSAIAVENIQLPDNPPMPTIGVHQSPNVTVASNGQGIHSGIGTGSHGGDGSGNGPGYGPGSDGGFGGNVYSLGGGVTAPVPIVTPEAEFSDEARRNKYQGLCLISLIVDAHGNPQNPRVIRALGMGLDEKALDAIRRYKFKPGTKDGKPVAVVMTIEVDFRLF
jgi:protein TonB